MMERTKHKLRIAVAATAALLVVGCSKGAPEGQVVARVNGDEITQSEINTEMAAAGVPNDARAKVAPAVLQRVIDRKLLVQAAEKSKLDQDPEYLLVRQRADEVLLAQRYLQRQSQSASQQPSADEIEAYLGEHPALTEQRQLLTLDQVRFPAPANPGELQALKGVKTLDELLNVLRARNVNFQRDTVQADTAMLPDELLANVRKLAPGEPLVILGGPVLTAAVVTGSAPVPTSNADATAIAKRRMVAEAVDNRLKQQNTALRQGAQIEYAKGMAPAAAPKAGR